MDNKEKKNEQDIINTQVEPHNHRAIIGFDKNGIPKVLVPVSGHTHKHVDENGNATMDEFWNPNGSYMAIEGITSPDGRILGKMAHSERRGEAVAMNIYGEQDMKIFESGVKYFK